MKPINSTSSMKKRKRKWFDVTAYIKGEGLLLSSPSFFYVPTVSGKA